MNESPSPHTGGPSIDRPSTMYPHTYIHAGSFLRCMLSGPCRATMACAGHCVHGPVRASLGVVVGGVVGLDCTWVGRPVGGWVDGWVDLPHDGQLQPYHQSKTEQTMNLTCFVPCTFGNDQHAFNAFTDCVMRSKPGTCFRVQTDMLATSPGCDAMYTYAYTPPIQPAHSTLIHTNRLHIHNTHTPPSQPYHSTLPQINRPRRPRRGVAARPGAVPGRGRGGGDGF